MLFWVTIGSREAGGEAEDEDEEEEWRISRREKDSSGSLLGR